MYRLNEQCNIDLLGSLIGLDDGNGMENEPHKGSVPADERPIQWLALPPVVSKVLNIMVR